MINEKFQKYLSGKVNIITKKANVSSEINKEKLKEIFQEKVNKIIS